MSKLSLTKYTGPWDQKHAVHLLNRTLFGYRSDELQDSLSEGFNNTIERLFAVEAMPPPPVHYTFDQDPEAPIGSSWVLHRQPTPTIPGLNNNRRATLRAWQMGLFNEGGVSIREKLVMFWHDHMPISAENNARMEFQYLNLLREHALGNFKSLVNDMTIAPGMLRYLNGNENTKEAPNENYSRELLELFTVGRGLEQGNGDYTNYTEQDVIELAKSLTGWRVTNLNLELPKGRFSNANHDESQKQLSERLGSKIIENSGDQEYKKAIDVIFENNEVAKFICRKLHIWFLDAEINAQVESEIIGPMADIMIADNYDISRALKTFIASEYFNDEAKHGCMISSPIDFVFKVLNTVGVELDIPFDAKYFFWHRIFRLSIELDMVILDVPSVAGWKAFYQAPQYYRYWINSVTLIKRNDFLNTMERGISISGASYGMDYVNTISQFDNIDDPTALIKQLADYLFAVPISADQLDYLKTTLLENGDESRWTNRYTRYINDPTEANKNAVENSLNLLFEKLLRMPEFQLM